MPKYIFTKCEFNELTLHLQVTKVQWSGSSFTFRILVFVTVAPVSQIPRQWPQFQGPSVSGPSFGDPVLVAPELEASGPS